MRHFVCEHTHTRLLPALLISSLFSALPGTEHALDAPAIVQPEPSAQRLPDVAGGLMQLLAVWEDDREGASGIWAQRFTATGITAPVLTPVGTNFRVSPQGGDHHVPRVAAIANTFYVVWESAISTTASEVLFARVTATTVERAVSLGSGRTPVIACASLRCFVAWQLGAGTVVGAPIDATPSPDGGVLLDIARNLGPAGGMSREPAVVTGLDPESFAVVYVNIATAPQISATLIFSDAGIGQPIAVTPPYLAQKSDPDIATRENGYAVVWTEGAFGMGTLNAVPLSPGLVPGGIVQIAQGGLTSQQPRIHRFGRRWVVAIENDTNPLDTHVVRLVLDDNLGILSSARLIQFPINSSALGVGQRAPALASVSSSGGNSNEAIVVESSPTPFTSDIIAVTASASADGGVIVTSNTRTPLAFSVNAQRDLALAPANGKFLASWADSRLGIGHNDIFTLRYQAAAQPGGTAAAVAADGGTQRAPTSVSSVDGAFVAWLDLSAQAIFAARILQGTSLDPTGLRLSQLYAPAIRPGLVSGWNGTQAYVLWETQSGVAGRTVTPFGVVGVETLITDGNQPSVAWDGAAWVVADRSVTSSQVRVTRVTVGATLPPLEVAPSMYDQQRPLVLSDGNTHSVVLWVELTGTPSTIGSLHAAVPFGVAAPVLIATNVDAARPIAGAFDGTNFVVVFSRDGSLALATVDFTATRVGAVTGGFAGERPSLAFSTGGQGLLGYDRFADAGTQRGYLRDVASLPDLTTCFVSQECSNGVCVMGQCGSSDSGFLPGDAGAPCDLPNECQTPLRCERNFCCPTPCPLECMTCETGVCAPRVPDVCDLPPRIVTQQVPAQCGVLLDLNLVALPPNGTWSFTTGNGPAGLTVDAMGHLTWLPPASLATSEVVTVSVKNGSAVTTGQVQILVSCGLDAGQPPDGGERADGGEGPRFATTACTGCSSGPGALALLAALLLRRRRLHSR